jgi:hypothetical protein
MFFTLLCGPFERNLDRYAILELFCLNLRLHDCLLFFLGDIAFESLGNWQDALGAMLLEPSIAGIATPSGQFDRLDLTGGIAASFHGRRRSILNFGLEGI